MSSQVVNTKSAETVENWCSRYSKDYISHAVYKTDSVKSIFHLGVVAPAEDVLRGEGKVEHEAERIGRKREIKTLLQLTSEEFANLVMLEEAISQEERGKDTHPNSAPEQLLNHENKENLPYTIEIIENKSHARKQEDGLATVEIDNLRFKVNISLWEGRSLAQQAFRDYVIDLKEKYHLPSVYEVMIAYDQGKRAIDRFDATSYQVFSDLCMKNSVKLYEDPEASLEEKRSYQELYFAFNQARRCIFGDTSLSCTIRAGYEEIFWEHAQESKVVVLYGEATSKIGSRTEETHLLAPWQHNDGTFFEIPLFQENVLILGPKSVLEPYAANGGAQIAYLEEMTSEQRNFFGVPDAIEQKIREGIPLVEPIDIDESNQNKSSEATISEEDSIGDDVFNANSKAIDLTGKFEGDLFEYNIFHDDQQLQDANVGMVGTDLSIKNSPPNSEEDSIGDDVFNANSKAIDLTGKFEGDLFEYNIFHDDQQLQDANVRMVDTDLSIKNSSANLVDKEEISEDQKKPKNGNSNLTTSPNLKSHISSLKRWHQVSFIVGSIVIAIVVALGCVLPIRFPQLPSPAFWTVGAAGLFLGLCVTTWGGWGLACNKTPV